MKGLLETIGFKSTNGNADQIPYTELPEIFPFPYAKTLFIQDDITTIFKRILVDTLERTYGIPEDIQSLLWDSCLASEKSEGLVTIIAKAMTEKSSLYLVYSKALKVVRIATPEEKSQIEADYKKQGQSSIGIAVSFTQYRTADMMKIYSTLEYCSIGSFYKKMNLSNAIVLKINEMRSSIGDGDKINPMLQASAIAASLAKGNDIMVDAKDIIESLKPDTETTDKASALIDRKRSFYLGLPASYITGLTNKGLSDTGEADTKAVERGLKAYYYSIVKPIVQALFGITTTYKSENHNTLAQGLAVLKDFEITSEKFIDMENKQRIVNKAFDLDEGAKGDWDEAIEDPQDEKAASEKQGAGELPGGA